MKIHELKRKYNAGNMTEQEFFHQAKKLTGSFYRASKLLAQVYTNSNKIKDWAR